MDADWLASRLERGRSVESIAREAGRSPSGSPAEAAKCVLLCATWHAEVEHGVKWLGLPPMNHHEAAA